MTSHATHTQPLAAHPGSTPSGPPTSPARAVPPTPLALVATLLALAAAIGVLAPTSLDGGGAMGMPMTHYMGLLAANQPWNLLLFMGGPVVLAETLTICELAILFSRATPRWVHLLSRAAGVLAGPLMVGITLHLLQYAVVPLTVAGEWAGWVDVVAVLAYLAGTVPMVGITLVHAGALGSDARSARRLHVTLVATFLVVAHVAMLAGMLDPTITGWTPATHDMPDGTVMPGTHH